MKRRSSFTPSVSLAVLIAATAFFHLYPAASSPIRSIVDAAVWPWAHRRVGPDDLSVDERIRERDAQIASLAEENTELRRAQSISGSITRPRVLTRVLWYDPDPSRRTIRIAKPEGADFSVGDAVVAPGDILVGKIISVSSRSAAVMLLDDPAFVLSVAVGDTVGVARGNGKMAMGVSFIPAEEPPAQGAIVRSAGREGMVPQGLLIGSAEVAPVKPSDPFALVRVVPLIDLDHLKVLFVLPTGSSLR